MRQNLRKTIRKDNRGSITVLVLVAIMFLSILGMTMLTMTSVNIQMKAVNGKAQESFYDADSILDTIKAGLANASSEATKEAYTAVLENYVEISRTSTMQEGFDRLYVDRLVKKLASTPIDGDVPADGSGSYYYNAEVLRGFLPEEVQGTLTEKSSEELAAGCDLLVCPSGQRYVLLKDIKITNREGSFETVLKTDIRMEIPNLSFSQQSVYSEYTRYAMVADDQIRVDGGQEVTVGGNLYAGTVNRNVADSTTNPEAGIVIADGGSLKVIGGTVITRGDILAANGGKGVFGTDGGLQCNVWAQNIKLEPASTGMAGSELAFYGKTYVEDDLEINGNNGKVTLSGGYYGYHYKENYAQGEEPSLKSEYSSAILINGRENTLDMSGLTDLVIAGRSFISRGDGQIADSEGNPNSDILTGESLSVKSNQMAYYVPKNFVIEITEGMEKDTSKIEFAFRGEDKKYYFDVKGYSDYVEFNVEEYLKEGAPLTRYYLQESGSRVYYYYINFKDQEAAGQFQKLYYAAKKDSVDSGAVAYLSNDGITLNSGSQMLLLSGNVLYSESAEERDSENNVTKKMELDIKIGNNGEEGSLFDQYGITYGRIYKSRQLGLVANLPEGYAGNIRLTDREKGKESDTDTKNAKNSMFCRLVDVEKLHGDLNGGSSVTDVTTAGGKKLGAIWLADRDFVFSADEVAGHGSKGIIIATGSVTLETDFEGMILAGEDIILGTGGTTLTANSKDVQDILKEDEIFNTFVKYFKEKDDTGSSFGESLDFGSYITYENWTKNEE